MTKSRNRMFLATAAFLTVGTVAMAHGPEGRDFPGRPDGPGMNPPRAGERECPPPPPCADCPKKHRMPFEDKEGRIEIDKVIRFLEKVDADHDGFISREERESFFEKKAMPWMKKPGQPRPDGPKGPKCGGPRPDGPGPEAGRPDEFRPGGPKLAGPKPDGPWGDGPKADRPGPGGPEEAGFWREGDGPKRGPGKMDFPPRPEGDWRDGPKMDGDKHGPRPEGDWRDGPKGPDGPKKGHKKHARPEMKNPEGPGAPDKPEFGPEGPEGPGAPDGPKGPEGPAPEE